MSTRPRILTGDTPTGRLHIGHWVGSLENRVRLQDTYDCYFLIANMHAYTTRAEKPADVRRDTLEIVKTVKGDDAYRPVAESKCPLLKK